MPKLIDLDQHITVPITDDHGTYTVEITVGEFFKRFLPGEQLRVVDAVPVEWLRKIQANMPQTVEKMGVDVILMLWQNEQEEE